MTGTRRALAVATLALAVACGAPAGDGGPTALSFVLFGDPTETAGYQTLVTEFEAANPDVTVEISPTATQDELLARLTTAFAGGQPPDVFLVNFRSYGQFAEDGVIDPVGPRLASSGAIAPDEYAPVALDAFRYDGEELTCMPQNLSSLVVYYNQDLFARAGVDQPAAGWTWGDFLATAEALTRGDVYGLGTDPQLIRVAPFVWSAGGEVVDDQRAPTTLTVDRGAAREGLDFFLDLQLVHGVVPSDRDEQAEDAESRFLGGRLGMYLGSRRSVPSFREVDAFAWDVASLPVAPGGEPATMLHSDAYCLAGAPATHQDEAWRFVEFAMGRRGQEILAETGRTVPSRIDVAQSGDFLEPDRPPASSEVFLTGIDTIRATPQVAAWAQVENEADRILEDVFYGRVDREDGVRRLVEDTRRLFATGGAAVAGPDAAAGSDGG